MARINIAIPGLWIPAIPAGMTVQLIGTRQGISKLKMNLEDNSLKLPNSWIMVELTDIGKIVSGGTPSTKESSYWGGNISWISPSDLTGYTSKFIGIGAKSITVEGLKNSSAVIMPAGSVHFSSRAPIGYTVISSCEITTNQGFKSLIPTQGVFNEYIYYYFKSAKQLAESRATGTTFKEISGTAFSKLPIPLPPTNEQHRIVAKIEALFSELDKGIESFKTAREQLKIYRQALLKHAFSGKLTEQWRAENQSKLESAEALLHRIQTEREQRYQQQLKDWEANDKSGSKPKAPKTLPPLTTDELAELPELPSEWLKVKVSHLLAEELCNGKSVKDRQGGFPVLRLNALIDGKINLSISKEGDWTEIEAKNYFVKDGDFLVSRGNGSKHLVGRGGIARIQVGRNNFVAFPDTMIRIRLSNSLVSSDYFSFCWDSLVIRNQVEKTARTTAGIYKINQALIEDYVFPLPCLEEQKVISNLLDESLSNIDQLDQTITTALQQAEALRQSILKKAFSGQLVPQDPNDEPASVLLEGIRNEKVATNTTKPKRGKHA